MRQRHRIAPRAAGARRRAHSARARDGSGGICGKKGRAPKSIAFMLAFLLPATPAHASIFEGETLDAVANALSWVVLVVVPIVAIAVFWLLHILPEKIAERRHHPQAEAIKTLCLLSLFFGGLLWPLAWLWAYSKPVLYKLAYGTDKVVHGEEKSAHLASEESRASELERLRRRLAELEGNLAGGPGAGGVG